jgi:hypothetical protein
MTSSRKTSSTSTVQFSDAARAAGLHKQGISKASVELLARIQSEPIPMQKRQRGKNNQPTPSRQSHCSIGPLIRHHLAMLRNEFYVTTPAGDNYLASMRRAGLL